jgi:protein-tyrosine phosphatase
VSGSPGDAAAPLRILTVCTGNICRSPAAAAYLSLRLGSDAVTVGSAGLHALVGEPVAPDMARLSHVPLDGFAARQLTAELVEDADLVLTMTREQRAAVVSKVPAAVRRTFTLAEFAALAEVAERAGLPAGSVAERLAALVALAPRLRSQHAHGQGDDIDDPYGGRPADYARAMLRIRAAVERLATALTGRGDDGCDEAVAHAG